MNISRRMALVAVVALGLARLAGAQTADPSGHWEGTLPTATGEYRIEFDFAKNPKGELTGTLTQPDRQLKGFPLSAITVEGATLRFEIPVAGGGRFHADISADGKSMAGTFESQAGPFPFKVARTGDARVRAVLRSAPISKQLEGTWNGKIEADGGLRVVLKLANEPDGTSVGFLISVDQGNLEVPVGIVEKARIVTLDLPMVSSTYAGVLNDAATEIAGTYKTPQGIELPLIFKR